MGLFGVEEITSMEEGWLEVGRGTQLSWSSREKNGTENIGEVGFTGKGKEEQMSGGEQWACILGLSQGEGYWEIVHHAETSKGQSKERAEEARPKRRW